MKKSILFVGNSYTFVNDLPNNHFAPLAAERGIEFDVTEVTLGGWRLLNFADPSDEGGKKLRAAIEGKHFDCVVLQDHSCGPIAMYPEFFAGAAALKALLEGQADRFILYATWGRRNGSLDLEIFGTDSRGMTERLAENYEKVGRALGMTVAHAGRAFVEYAAAHPDAELYMEDGSHPSELGSRVAAEAILAEILK